MIYFLHHQKIGDPLVLAGILATVALSYHFFERPILKFKQRFESIRTRPA